MERRIPSLDGVRAIAVTLVFTWHLLAHADLPLIWRVDYGNLGVRVFFIISGFLITSLLLAERERTGKISISNFYVRRVFRIFPAYYVFLLVMAVLLPTGRLVLHKVDFLPSAAFFSDYETPHDALGHTWSLAVEEQFYLLWPGVIVLLGLRRAFYVCVALLVIAPTFRMLVDLSLWPEKPMRGFECVADALACGCILACVREKLWNNRFYQLPLRGPHPTCDTTIHGFGRVACPYPVRHDRDCDVELRARPDVGSLHAIPRQHADRTLAQLGACRLDRHYQLLPLPLAGASGHHHATPACDRHSTWRARARDCVPILYRAAFPGTPAQALGRDPAEE
jgi:hypothetical protein